MTYPTFEELAKVLNGYSNGVHTRAFIDGVESERERIKKLITEEVIEWIDHDGDAYYPDVLTDLIDGKTND